MTVGERIVFLREERNISQKDLAARLHMTAATLSRYENNIYQPKTEFLLEMCRILETSADFLLGLTEDYNSDKNDFSDGFHISAQEYRMITQFRALSDSNKTRIDERIKTLLEAQDQ